MIYELKKYSAHPGKEEALMARFAASTMPIFERLGITVVHCWTSPDEPGVFYYMTRYADEQARADAWSAFAADPAWKEVKASSEVEGPLLASQSTLTLLPTQFSPAARSNAA